MGNKLGRRRQVVDEKYTRPQGLYNHKDVDHKKLRKLILESKLAPCFPGDEECTCDHEECPICFLEEQRVIEAKIRIQQQELQDEEDRMLKRQEVSCSSANMAPVEVEYCSVAVPSSRSPVESEEIVASLDSSPSPMIRAPPPPPPPPLPRTNRDDDFDVDLEDIMVMEAIWLSIQENSRQRNPVYSDVLSEQYALDHNASPAMGPPAGSSSSPSGGLACAIAALAERQQIPDRNISDPQAGRFYNRVDGDIENYPPADRATESSTDGRMTMAKDDRECYGDRGSDVAEAGTSYASSDGTEDAAALPLPDEIDDSLQNVPEPIIPESFEEQMMLAMAVSLAEARALANGPGVSWQ
ncbi:hypothetical protein FH972_019454 [Carpinus fangiana]|uniref:RING-type domain-containing protein n=1 Tax=Carpinus fangiana TaxID=176857 RepID=A0A5N6RRQ2_9ROSI|nr:hypothetical protein FH972_019454 [Carpinus fangiana]